MNPVRSKEEPHRTGNDRQANTDLRNLVGIFVLSAILITGTARELMVPRREGDVSWILEADHRKRRFWMQFWNGRWIENSGIRRKKLSLHAIRFFMPKDRFRCDDRGRACGKRIIRIEKLINPRAIEIKCVFVPGYKKMPMICFGKSGGIQKAYGAGGALVDEYGYISGIITGSAGQ